MEVLYIKEGLNNYSYDICTYVYINNVDKPYSIGMGCTGIVGMTKIALDSTLPL